MPYCRSIQTVFHGTPGVSQAPVTGSQKAHILYNEIGKYNFDNCGCIFFYFLPHVCA